MSRFPKSVEFFKKLEKALVCDSFILYVSVTNTLQAEEHNVEEVHCGP